MFSKQHYLHKQTAGPWLLNKERNTYNIVEQFRIIKKNTMDYKLVMVF